jgi:hypothetical protein
VSLIGQKRTTKEQTNGVDIQPWKSGFCIVRNTKRAGIGLPGFIPDAFPSWKRWARLCRCKLEVHVSVSSSRKVRCEPNK